jgi:GNAT superfamily N-acetyltransferase
MHGNLSTEELLHRDKDLIANTPGLANAGIALAVVEPENVGWAEVVRLLDEYGFIAFAAADKRTVFDRIRAQCGTEGDLSFWDSFTASASETLQACSRIIETARKDLAFETSLVPSPRTIEDVMCLNRDVGVSPLPAWYMRGEGPPSMTSWIMSPEGRMIACASGSMRYHAKSRLAGTYYVGSVSVSPSARGKGLGTLATALLIRDGIKAFDPKSITGIAQPTNAPSCGMLMKCALVHDPSRASVIYNRSGAFHTR